MIVGVRSALICDELVDLGNGKGDYKGVSGGMLTAGSRPGYVQAVLAFQLEIDNKPSEGAFHVKAKGFEHVFPFALPGGHWLTAAAIPLMIPILEEGPLYVGVTAAGRAARKPWGFKWWLEFSPDATDAAPGAAEAVLEEANKLAETIKMAMVTKAGPALKAN